MTNAERKAIGYIVRLGADMFAATTGSPVWEHRHRMREYIGQFVDERLPLLNDSDVLAETIVAANKVEAKP